MQKFIRYPFFFRSIRHNAFSWLSGSDANNISPRAAVPPTIRPMTNSDTHIQLPSNRTIKAVLRITLTTAPKLRIY